jgi:hypothetical protein
MVLRGTIFVLFLAATLLSAPVAAVAQNYSSNQYQGRLRGDDQRRFDSYYSRWLDYRAHNDWDQIMSMEKRMIDVYAHNGIPHTVAFFLVASSGAAQMQNAYSWQGRLKPEDQQRFDSYYSRCLQYRERKDWEQVESMERRMLDVYAHNGVPANVPWEFVASANLAQGAGYTAQRDWRDERHGHGLQVVQALYGTPGHQMVVTGRLQDMVREGRLSVRVNNETMGGDPDPGQRKQLSVVYRHHGQEQTITVPEGDQLNLPQREY